jgi:hypothetical protein
MILFVDLLGTSTIFDYRTYQQPVRFVYYSILRLSRKDAGICAYCTVGREPSLYLYVILCTVLLFTNVLRSRNDQFHTQQCCVHIFLCTDLFKIPIPIIRLESLIKYTV